MISSKLTDMRGKIIFGLCYGKSCADIAAEIGTSENSVRQTASDLSKLFAKNEGGKLGVVTSVFKAFVPEEMLLKVISENKNKPIREVFDGIAKRNDDCELENERCEPSVQEEGRNDQDDEGDASAEVR